MPSHVARRAQYQDILGHLSRVYGQLIPSGANWGQISFNEGEFLMNRILDEQPRHVLEIGTAGGASAVHILKALGMLGGERRFTTVECLEHCYFDPSRKPGFLVEQAYGALPEGFYPYSGLGSFDLGQVLAEAPPVDFLFVDANHGHPWASLDTALALPFLAPNSMAVYHDINLHLLCAATKSRDRGAHHLFYHLPARQKQTVGDLPYPNIGSLRLVGPAKAIMADLLSVMFHFPWEAAAWPPLDLETLLRFKAFLGKHFGRQYVAAFMHGLEALGLQGNA